jgi:hypothetical protein
MRNVSLVAVVATLGLAIPFTLLALAGVAWTTENLTQIATFLAGPGQLDWAALARETWARLPEVAGMIIGQALILVIFLLARREVRADHYGTANTD